MATTEELKAVLQTADPWAVDLLLSALAAAVASRRRATCTTPFPTSLCLAADGERDYDALLENVQSLPPADRLEAAVDSLSQQQASLLHWLLTHSQRPVAGIRRCTLRSMQEQMPLLTGWLADVGRNPGLRPHAVLQLNELPAGLVDGSGDRVLAFHGSSMENMHSILHHGLLNASGTRLERTGYVFGKGIYFSSEPHVAFAFSLPTECWRQSGLGQRLRCLLACSVQQEHALGTHNTDLVPDKYLLVERMDAVQIHFLLIYADTAPTSAEPQALGAAAAAAQGPIPRQQSAMQTAAAPVGQGAGQPQQQQQQPQRPVLLYLIAAYLGWLVFVGLRDNWPFIRRMLRRKFGIRL